MTLELVPWRGDNVPLLSSNGVSRSFGISDYLSMLEQSWRYGGNLYPTGATGVTYTQNGKAAEPVANNFEGYVRQLFYTDGPVAAVEWKRVEVFAQAPMLFQKRRDGRPGDLYDDDSLDLVRAPWVGGTASDLQARSLLFADLGGNAYVVVIDDELVVLRPDYVEIVLEPRMVGTAQVGWKQVAISYTELGPGGGTPAVFMRGEYAHYAPKPDPLASYRGMSWLTPVIREVQADVSAIDGRLAFQNNASTPNLAVKIPQPMTPDQFKEFVEMMDSQHRGAVNSGKTLYTAGGADVTVVGSNMREMDFTALLGKSETRVANAGGLHPAIVGFSEGMQGSSMNAGNYQAAKRQTVDTTFRHLWSNWCGSLQQLFPPPKAGDRLWYDIRDIPFLHDDAKDLAAVQQTQGAVITTYTREGFKPESAIAAVRNDDIGLLEHTGLTSVQLTPPQEGSDPNGSWESPTTEAPDQPVEDTYAGDETGRSQVRRSYRFRHGWIPVSPLAVLPADAVDEEYGRELDSVEFGDKARIVAREHDVTVESPTGSDIAIHATPSVDDAQRWADAIERREIFHRRTFSTEPHDGGVVVVRFGDHESELTDPEATDVAQALRDMAYLTEDHRTVPADSEAHVDDFATERSAAAWVWDVDEEGNLTSQGVGVLARHLDLPDDTDDVVRSSVDRFALLDWVSRNVLDAAKHLHGADGRFIRKLLGVSEDLPDPEAHAAGRVVAHGGSVGHFRLRPRPLKVDDRVFSPGDRRQMGTVLAVFPADKTMRVRWDDGRTEVRPLASVTDPIPEPRRRYAATPPEPVVKLGDDLPTRTPTAAEKLADKVATGGLSADAGRRLAAGESPVGIVDSRSPEAFRERERAKLNPTQRAAVDGLDADRKELYWLRRTAGQSHADAVNGLGGAKPAKKVAKRAPTKTATTPLSTDPAVRAVQVENRVRQAYRAVKSRPVVPRGNADLRVSGWVSMADLRDEIGRDVPPAEIDAALKRLNREPGVVINSDDFSVMLSPREKAAALKMGGQDNHWLTIADPSDRPLPEPPNPAPRKATKTAAARRTAPRAAVAAESPSAVVDRLRASTSRDEARAIVTGMKVKDLKAIADAAGVFYGAKYTKAKLVDELVQWLVGRRLVSDVISRPGPSAISPNG